VEFEKESFFHEIIEVRGFIGVSTARFIALSYFLANQRISLTYSMTVQNALVARHQKNAFSH